MLFELYKGLVKSFAIEQRPWLQNERLRINVPPTPNHQNVILAFFDNICVSLLNNSVDAKLLTLQIPFSEFQGWNL